eukprot:scaffold73448_cov48-Phaeocystis_antarctica.AAC.1
MLVRPSGRLVSAREVQLLKASWPMLVRPSGRLVSAREVCCTSRQMESSRATTGEAQPQRLRLCTTVNYFTGADHTQGPREVQPLAKGIVADIHEAIGQAGQSEGGTVEEGVAGQREGGAVGEGVVADAGEAIGKAGQRKGGAVVEGAVADAGEAVRQTGQSEGGTVVVEGVVADAREAVGRLVSARKGHSINSRRRRLSQKALSKALSPMLVRPSGRLVSAREVQFAKA